MHLRVLPLLLLSLTLCITEVSNANASAISFGPGDVVGNFSDLQDRVVGWSFTTNSSITVTELGFYDALGDGLVQSHDVGLYTSTGTLLVSGTVASGTGGSLDGLFRYVDVSDTALAANTTYVIAALVLGNADAWTWTPPYLGAGVNSFTVDPAITLGAPGSARFECCNFVALEFPDQEIGVAFPADPRSAFLGPNFQLVPEPSTGILVFGGITCLAGISQRRRRVPTGMK